MKEIETTRKMLLEHCNAYPKLQAEDICKYIFQSVCGCEHLMSDYDAVLENIKREYASMARSNARIDRLDGGYSRVHLSYLDMGLRAETLAKLFCLSSKKESDTQALIEEKISILRDLVLEGKLPFDQEKLDTVVDVWKNTGYSAIHHSENFRKEYMPAYRVVANKYVDFLPLFARIDSLMEEGNVKLDIESESAAAKSILINLLSEVYDCNSTDEFIEIQPYMGIESDSDL